MTKYDIIIIGAGAAGLMAANIATKRGKKTLVIEHTNKIGEKIRISGGGRCNFTNLYTSPTNYISQNKHFIKSALASYTQHDFIKLVEKYNIKYHEKTLGQLFCDSSSQQIINMLLAECSDSKIVTNCTVNEISRSDSFRLTSNIGEFTTNSLIIATGGLSIPKLGASDFGYKIAKQFGINVITTYPALVPLILNENELAITKQLAGISLDVIASCDKVSFKENMLFTHRGISGPAILQISSYIAPPHLLKINLFPEINIGNLLIKEKSNSSTLTNLLKYYIPNRVVEYLFNATNIKDKNLAEYKNIELEQFAEKLSNFTFSITSSEGYNKAEVTGGGVDTNELSSKTMMSKKISGLYFIGEVVDVTGWLGGYNFQWAWSSGVAAGTNC